MEANIRGGLVIREAGTPLHSMYSTCLKICLLVGVTYYRLCGCSVLIVISLLVNYRLCECSVLSERLLLENYRFVGVAH